MDGQVIELKKEAKYLGVNLDTILSSTSMLIPLEKKCQAAVGLLYNLINAKSSLSLKNKLLVYKVIFRPIMLYAVPIGIRTKAT